MAALRFSCLLCRVFLVRRSKLLLEILALRQQLAVLARQQKRPRLKNRDRIFWILISRIFTGWKDCLQLVKPDTVIRWHRKGYRAYWRWKSRPRRPGRPTIDWDLIKLVRRLASENPLWGAPRVHSEVELLGYEVNAVHCFQVHEVRSRAESFTDLDDVPQESHERDRGLRLLCRPYRHVPPPVLFRSSLALPSARRSFQCHVESDAKMDCAASPGA